VIVEGLMTKWRAMTVWTPEYLKSTVGDEPIEIMSGREADPHYELNIERHRKRVGFCEYVDMVFSGRETNDYYLVANNVFFRNPGALALLGDLELFTEYLRPTAHENQTFLWLGPAGTVTPLHHDTCNILMAQVAGRKRVRLIAPSQLQWVYNDISVYSRVDCENPDLERWPEFRNVKMLDVVLEPGEVLFLPVGWWHHVRSLDVSITVSFTSFVFPNQYEWFTPKIVKQ
jgi:hypothetical protein